jgi:hypothetical protein
MLREERGLQKEEKIRKRAGVRNCRKVRREERVAKVTLRGAAKMTLEREADGGGGHVAT